MTRYLQPRLLHGQCSTCFSKSQRNQGRSGAEHTPLVETALSLIQRCTQPCCSRCTWLEDKRTDSRSAGCFRLMSGHLEPAIVQVSLAALVQVLTSTGECSSSSPRTALLIAATSMDQCTRLFPSFPERLLLPLPPAFGKGRVHRGAPKHASASRLARLRAGCEPGIQCRRIGANGMSRKSKGERCRRWDSRRRRGR